MDANGAIDNATSERSRISYVEHIIELIESFPNLFPTPNQERFYQDALLQLAGAISSNVEEIDQRTLCDFPQKTRKENLKEILNQLREMERIRLYDPPAETELGFYRNIKHHAWSIFAFGRAKHAIEVKEILWSDKLRYYSPFVMVSNLENLGEVNKHLQDISVSVTGLDITNGSVMKPFLGMETDCEVVPMPLCTLCEKKTNMFYRHKFMLALWDLVSTHIVDSPPTGDEKTAYQSVLDNVLLNPSYDASTGEVSEHKDTYLDPTIKLVMEQVLEMMDELARHVRNIFNTIFIKLSIKECFDNLRLHSKAEFERIVQELVRNCEVPKIHLKGYIDALDEALVIATYILCFIEGVVAEMKALKGGVWICLEPLHALTMLNCCRLMSGDTSKLLDQSKKDAKRNCLCKRKGKMNVEGSSNAKILLDILMKLRAIGYSNLNSRLDKEEIQLLENILKNVASSVDFSFSAITYVRQSESEYVKSPDEVRRKSKEKMFDFDMNNVKLKYYAIWFNLRCCIKILRAYKIGLVSNPNY